MNTGLLTTTDFVPEQRLLAAIIAKAVTDCCDRPTNSKKGARITGVALDALRFLFKDNEACRSYCSMLDMNLPSFRTHLVSTMHGTTGAAHITERSKRCFRINYARFRPLQGNT